MLLVVLREIIGCADCLFGVNFILKNIWDTLSFILILMYEKQEYLNVYTWKS